MSRPSRAARPRDPSPPAATGPAAEPLRVERRASWRGALVVAGQRIHVGTVHTGRTLAVEAANNTWRIHDDDEVLVAEVPRTTTKPVARFKVHKPGQGGVRAKQDDQRSGRPAP